MTILELPNRHEKELDVRIKDAIAASATPVADMSFREVHKLVEEASNKTSPSGLKAALDKHRKDEAAMLIDSELGRRVFQGLDEWDLSMKSPWEDIEIAIFRHCGFRDEKWVREAIGWFYTDCNTRKVAPRLAVMEFEASMRKGLPADLSLVECARRKREGGDPDISNVARVFLLFQKRVDDMIARCCPEGLPDEYFPKRRPAP